MREHWKTGRWWMSRRRSNASNWQRFLDQRPQPAPPLASRHFRRVNFNNSTPPRSTFVPRWLARFFRQLSIIRGPALPRANKRANVTSRNIDRSSFSLSPFTLSFLSLLLGDRRVSERRPDPYRKWAEREITSCSNENARYRRPQLRLLRRGRSLEKCPSRPLANWMTVTRDVSKLSRTWQSSRRI